MNPPNVGYGNVKLVFADGSEIQCYTVEHIPYEPSAYHWDEGIIVASPSGNYYFVSLGTAMVYGPSDTDEDELTRHLEDARCPEAEEFLRQCEIVERKATPPSWRTILPPIFNCDPGDETALA